MEFLDLDGGDGGGNGGGNNDNENDIQSNSAHENVFSPENPYLDICRGGTETDMNQMYNIQRNAITHWTEEILHDGQLSDAFSTCIKSNNSSVLSFFHNVLKRWYEYDKAAELSCLYNEPNILSWIAINGYAIKWNECLLQACKGGHLTLAKQIVNQDFQGAPDIFDYNDALNGACRGNHEEIIQWAIDQGASKWWGAFESACYGNHIDLVKKIHGRLKHVSNKKVISLMETMCIYGYLQIVEYLAIQFSQHITVTHSFKFYANSTSYLQMLECVAFLLKRNQAELNKYDWTNEEVTYFLNVFQVPWDKFQTRGKIVNQNRIQSQQCLLKTLSQIMNQTFIQTALLDFVSHEDKCSEDNFNFVISRG